MFFFLSDAAAPGRAKSVDVSVVRAVLVAKCGGVKAGCVGIGVVERDGFDSPVLISSKSQDT